MQNGEALLLRIFVGESDRFEHKPVYEVIVTKARECGLAGGNRVKRHARLRGERSYTFSKADRHLGKPAGNR